MLLRDTSGKNINFPWLGPVKILEGRRENSYVVAMPDGGRKGIHTNKLRPYVARFDAVGVILDDPDFGSVEELPTDGRGADEAESQKTAEEKEMYSVMQQFVHVFSGVHVHVFSYMYTYMYFLE